MTNLDTTAKLYRAWMDAPIDHDFIGQPIARHTAYSALDAMTGEVAFAAGYAAAYAEVIRLNRIRDEMKEQWGVSRNVSFDKVWAHALTLKLQTEHLLYELVTATVDEHGLTFYAAQNNLTFSNMVAALMRARLPECPIPPSAREYNTKSHPLAGHIGEMK